MNGWAISYKTATGKWHRWIVLPSKDEAHTVARSILGAEGYIVDVRVKRWKGGDK